jgi:D-xylose transport system substrate-binding protein
MKRKSWLRFVAVLLAFVFVAAACGDDSDSDSGDGGDDGGGEAAGAPCPADDSSVWVLLPDSASSDRWESDDRPAFEAAFDEAGVDYNIVNAEGDAQQQQSQAEQAIAEGAGVIMLTNLDSASGATIIDQAEEAGVATVDYDRETVDELEGGDPAALENPADVYVSFSNEQVGAEMAVVLEPEIDALDTDVPNVVMLNGSPTDDNARLFKEGYNATVSERVDAGDWNLVADEDVPDWDNDEAGRIMENILTDANNEVDAVFAANDGLAGAAISAMQAAGLDTTTIPVSGQDATVPGIQLVLSGDQSMTVYKNIDLEAQAAADAAVALLNCEDVSTAAPDTAPVGGGAAVLLDPVGVTVDNIDETVYADGFRTEEEVCVGEFAEFC